MPRLATPRRRPQPSIPAMPPNAAEEYAASLVRALEVADTLPRLTAIGRLLEQAAVELAEIEARGLAAVDAHVFEHLRGSVRTAQVHAESAVAPMRAQVHHVRRGHVSGRQVFEPALLRELAARGFSMAARRWILQVMSGDSEPPKNAESIRHRYYEKVSKEDKRARPARADLEKVFADAAAADQQLLAQFKSDLPATKHKQLEDVVNAMTAQRRRHVLGALAAPSRD